jgi:hypothetical protein
VMRRFAQGRLRSADGKSVESEEAARKIAHSQVEQYRDKQ